DRGARDQGGDRAVLRDADPQRLAPRTDEPASVGGDEALQHAADAGVLGDRDGGPRSVGRAHGRPPRAIQRQLGAAVPRRPLDDDRGWDERGATEHRRTANPRAAPREREAIEASPAAPAWRSADHAAP